MDGKREEREENIERTKMRDKKRRIKGCRKETARERGEQRDGLLAESGVIYVGDDTKQERKTGAKKGGEPRRKQ